METPVLEALMRAEAEGAEDTARRAAGAQESETVTSLLVPQLLHNLGQSRSAGESRREIERR
jgi:hypothetical protein